VTETIVDRFQTLYLGRGLAGEQVPPEADEIVELSVDLDQLGDELETAVRFPEHLQAGLATDRPDASSVPAGGLYSATDTGVVYQSDGTGWATWATAGGGGGASPSDTAGWLPLTTVLGGVPDLVWDAGDSLIPTYTPF
jgi:hypothetical protein